MSFSIWFRFYAAFLAVLFGCSGESKNDQENGGGVPDSDTDGDADTGGEIATEMETDTSSTDNDDTDTTDTLGDSDTGAGGDTESEGGNDAGAEDSDTHDSDLAATALVTSITDHGVTWTFSSEVQAGRFITGDWFVVGPVTVSAIDPPPGEGRNGSVVNLPPTQNDSPWDDRVEGNRFDASLRSDPPIVLMPGDTLLSSISAEEQGSVENWMREGNGESSLSPVWSISQLTCLGQTPFADAFRPSYSDQVQRLYRLSEIDRTALGSLDLPAGADIDASTLSVFATRFIRPWVDNLFYGFDAQVEYMPMYGREMARAAGLASLMLLCDLPVEMEADQEKLLIGFVQHGIDLWGLVRGGYPGWFAHGGHGSGRKWFLVWSGMLLGDDEMAAPTATFPDLMIGEDMHTAYAEDVPGGGPTWWNESGVVYTGHMGIWRGEVVSDTAGWGPYEHLSPDEWESDIGEGYRRCCTSLAWVGEALAARLVGAMDNWAHPAFFDYVDRWMDPAGDAEYALAIEDLTGWSFSAAWQAHGQAWDALIEEMWAEYR